MSDQEPEAEPADPMQGLVVEAVGTVTYPDGSVPREEPDEGA